MGNQHHDLCAQQSTNAFFKNTHCNLRINSRQRVVEQIDVCLGVNCSGKADSRFLSSTDVDASLANHSEVSVLEIVNVLAKARCFKTASEQTIVVWLSKQDVVTDRTGDNEWLLLDIRHRSLD
jgi:hypothetical protein